MRMVAEQFYMVVANVVLAPAERLPNGPEFWVSLSCSLLKPSAEEDDTHLFDPNPSPSDGKYIHIHHRKGRHRLLAVVWVQMNVIVFSSTVTCGFIDNDAHLASATACLPAYFLNFHHLRATLGLISRNKHQ